MLRVAAGEGEDRGNDHHTCQNSDGRIEELNLTGGIFNADILFHVGAEGDQNTHGDGQGIEHLAHGGHHCHPGEVLQVRNQQVSDTGHGAGARDGVHTDHDCQDKQDRHHELGDSLNAVFHTHVDDGKSESQENEEPELRGDSVRDEFREKSI